MCVSPLKILNRSKVQVAGLSPDTYTVPCGKCWQCQQARRDGFTVRSIFEFMQAKQNGGFTLFLTLTYDNINLHLYRGVPLFCKDDVQKYLKRVRISVLRHYESIYGRDTASKIVSKNIRYFVSSENGDKYHRPHYHILFFVKSPAINQWLFRKLAISAWSHGFAVPSKENYGFVTDVRGCKYVAKYVGKSMIDNEYFNNCLSVFEERVNKFETEYNRYFRLMKYSKEKDTVILDKLSRLSKLIDINKSVVDKLSDNRPFLLCSKGLGSFAFSDDCPKEFRLTQEMFVDGFMNVLDNKTSVCKCLIPQYYKRKLFYNVSSEIIPKVRKVSYKINQIGIDIKTQNFKKYFEIYDKNLSILLSQPISDHVLTMPLCKDLGFPSVLALRNHLVDVTSRPEWKEFALLYSNYSQYLADDELKDEYTSPEPYYVYNFRQYVGSDTHTSLDYDSVNDYHDFYISILYRIHDIVFRNPLFPQTLALLEVWQSEYLDYLTCSRYVSDKTVHDARISSDLSLFG